MADIHDEAALGEEEEEEEEVREVVSLVEAEGVKENQLLYEEAGAASGLTVVALAVEEAGVVAAEAEAEKEEKRLETEKVAPCIAPEMPPLLLL